MSKALDYLLEKRPEAMGAYFTFLKKAGTHLDPKTAALISVITKVHAKTANGLRQYLPRAIKAGASADEIIDSLLFAMPALGFSKIVWAVDVILEMNLPEFSHMAKKAPSIEWIAIADASSIKTGSPQFVKHGRTAFYLVRTGDAVTVYSAECPHNKNVIPESGLDGTSLICPFHEWKFDLATGACTHVGTKPLSVVQSKVESGQVYIAV